ncbi:MAG: FeoA domain-containing protein [Chloroflexi bacterium]|nr:FeoA domain-containing protein [Chloroflexota bacterium]
MITPQMEEYLESLGKLQERGESLTPTALARELHVAAPTVTEMLHRLTEQGYITYEQRQPIELTAAGVAAASTVIRRHRLWERFLQDVLGLRWDQVHEQACQLEHVTSPELEQRLARAAGEPDSCPHGHAIPAGDNVVSETSAIPLSSLAADQAARVISVSEEPDLLRRLNAVGIVPGAELHIEQAAPDGRLTLRIAGALRELAGADAARVQVVSLAHSNDALPGSKPDAVVSLADLATGEEGIVHGFQAGRGLVARCLALGFTPGTPVRMLQNLRGGPVIALVRETRVALGRGEAQRILVSPTPAAELAQPAVVEAAHD